MERKYQDGCIPANNTGEGHTYLQGCERYSPSAGFGHASKQKEHCESCKPFTRPAGTGIVGRRCDGLCKCHTSQNSGDWEEELLKMLNKNYAKDGGAVATKYFNEIQDFIRTEIDRAERRGKEQSGREFTALMHQNYARIGKLPDADMALQAVRVETKKKVKDELREKVKILQHNRPLHEIGSHLYDRALGDVLNLL